MQFLALSSLLTVALAAAVRRADTCAASPDATTLSSGAICTKSCASDRAGGDYKGVFAGSFDACISACGNDEKCVTAQYEQGSGFCYLKSTVNELIPSTNVDTVDCCPGVYTDPSTGSICKPTCGQDRPGGDYGNQYTGSFPACIRACGSDPKCKTAQYSLQNGYCYFKNGVNAFSPTRDVNTVDCCPGPKTFAARTCTTKCQTDRPGGDYAAVYVGSVQACVDACGNDVRCKTAQYSVGNGFCYLKDGVNEAVAAGAVDTVDCS